MSVSNFFSILPKYGLHQVVKKIESDYNSVIIFYQVTFTSSYWKLGLYSNGTTVVCNKTPTEPSFLAARKWFNRLNSGRSMIKVSKISF